MAYSVIFFGEPFPVNTVIYDIDDKIVVDPAPIWDMLSKGELSVRGIEIPDEDAKKEKDVEVLGEDIVGEIFVKPRSETVVCRVDNAMKMFLLEPTASTVD